MVSETMSMGRTFFPRAGLLLLVLFGFGLSGAAGLSFRSGKQPAAVDAAAEPTSGFRPFTHTLIQYLSSSTCMGDRYVCLQLRVDRMVQTMPPSAIHGGSPICNKLSSLDESDGLFRLSSCYPKGPAEGCTPKVCHACESRSPIPPFKLGECHGEAMGGNILTSLKLLKGDAQENKLKCASKMNDIGLARWCDRWPARTREEKGAKSKVETAPVALGAAAITAVGPGQCLDASGHKYDGYYSTGAKTAEECKNLLGELKGVDGVRGAQLHTGWTCHIRVDDAFDPRDQAISTGWAGGNWQKGTANGPVAKADGDIRWQCWALGSAA